MEEIESLLKTLQKKDEVEAVFITGSYGTDSHSQDSDLDLVVILKENTEHIRSVYTWVGGVFADVFFFDHADLERIRAAATIPANSMDGIFLTWLLKATIAFDKVGSLQALKDSVQTPEKLLLTDQEKRND